MNTLRRTTLLIASLVALFSSSAISKAENQFINGQWNNKPWPKQKILEGVQNDEPEALAEWAYCSYYGENGIVYQPKLIFQRAKAAAEKESIMGKCMLARCRMAGTATPQNLKKSASIIQEALPSKHPYAIWSLARLQALAPISRNPNPIAHDPVKALDTMEKLLKEDVIQAYQTLGDFYGDKANNFYNPERSIKLQLQSLRTYRSVIKACDFKATLHNNPSYLTEEDLVLIEKIVDDAAYLQFPYALYAKGLNYLETGYRDLGVKYMIQAANRGSTKAFGTLSILEQKSRTGRNNLLSTDTKTANKLSHLSYMAGHRSSSIIFGHVKYLIGSRNLKMKSFKREAAEIVRLSREMIKNGNCNVHPEVANYYFEDAVVYGGPKENMMLAESHTIYHTNHEPDFGCLSIGVMFMQNNKQHNDFIRSYAALKTGLSVGNQYHRNRCKHLLGILENKKMTPEQIKQGNALHNEGYPLDEKFRQAAFKHLKQSGDLPENAKFSSSKHH